jgi:hypothetical protein
MSLLEMMGEMMTQRNGRISQLTDEALLKLAYRVGDEIDSRWRMTGGQESVRLKEC